MKKIIRFGQLGALMLLGWLSPGLAVADVVLVGSNGLPFVEISKTKLRDLYTGQSQQVGETAVLVIDRDEQFGERSHFIYNTLGFTTEEFSTVQRLLECIGVSKTPMVAKSPGQMIEMITRNPNALGYLSKKELAELPTQTKLRQIRVLPQ
ncbi:MAG TPA: hypothetical protein VFV57_00325 [Limnobacter sp.]|nr:hypothetical protein [Limnobacter sp.]